MLGKAQGCAGAGGAFPGPVGNRGELRKGPRSRLLCKEALLPLPQSWARALGVVLTHHKLYLLLH